MALAGLAIAVAFLPGLLLKPSSGWTSYLLFACFLLAAAFAVLFMFAALMPRWFLMGIALQENGFEYRRPLRSPKVIPYSSVDRIQAVKAGDGETGDAVRLLICSRVGKLALSPDMLHGSGLLKVLESRFSLDHDAFREALRHEPRGLNLLVGKRFTIYEKQA